MPKKKKEVAEEVSVTETALEEEQLIDTAEVAEEIPEDATVVSELAEEIAEEVETEETAVETEVADADDEQEEAEAAAEDDATEAQAEEQGEGQTVEETDVTLVSDDAQAVEESVLEEEPDAETPLENEPKDEIVEDEKSEEGADLPEENAEVTAESEQKEEIVEESAEERAADEEVTEKAADAHAEQDEKAEVAETPAVPKDKKPSKLGEFVKKHKKLVAIVCVVLVLALGGLIAGLVITRNNVYVAEATDLYEALEKDKGSIIILSGDVTIDGDVTLNKKYDINLKGHTLTVNGKLTYNLGDSDKGVTIGTDLLSAKKEEDAPGKLIAAEFEFNGNNAELAVNSPIFFDKALIGAKTVSFADDIESKNFTLNAGDATLFGDTVVTTFTANVTNFSVARLNATTAHITATGDIEVKSAEAFHLGLDGKNIVIGTVTCMQPMQMSSLGRVFISGAESVKVMRIDGILELKSTVGKVEISGYVASVHGGSAVYLIGSATVDDVMDAAKVVVGLNAKVGSMRNVANVIIQEKLAAPKAVVMNDTSSTPGITVEEVANATAYSYKIGDFEGKSTSPSFVIGETLNPGTYTIYVKAIVDVEGNEKYLDSDYTEYTFSFTATLTRPAVTFSALTPTAIEIVSAEHVDYYSITVNGGEEIKAEQTPLVTVKDLSEHIKDAGSYSIIVVAKSNTTYYNASVPTLITYVNRVQLSAPVLSGSTEGKVSTVSWEAVDHAVYYKVVYGENTVYTSSTDVTVIGTATVVVTAVGSGYYDDSAASTIIIG